MKKVLVVEDNWDLQSLLSYYLQAMGLTVIMANNGKEGVEKALKERPQMIFMDIMMPGMDGREATRQIRSNPETKNIPIVVVSVLHREEDIEKCMEADCNDFLVKPVTREQIQEKVQAFIPDSIPTLQQENG